MNRTDRLLAIILELQAKRQQRAEDLAATFETSKRTIYRDIQALAEAGVPLISTPGKGYALVEGYFLPPVRFTVDEATTLLLGSELMAQSFDAEYRQAANVAGRKIDALLPASEQARVAELRDRIRFIATNLNTQPEEANRLRALRQAILTGNNVRFHYQARHSEAAAVRDVSPYSLAHVNDTWQLIGYCHLRHDMRVFRVSRLTDLQVLAQRFDRATYDADWQRAQSQLAAPQQPVIGTLLFDAESARWVREDPFFYISAREETPAGLLVTLRAPDTKAVLQWVLGWGSHIRAIEPDALREALINAARNAVAQWINSG
jgi:predicted DNA-binding transcriptional regulator YafY